MKKTLCLSLFILILPVAYSQNYDLIITTKGDSIACHIDNIKDSVIYFEMKSNNHWVVTSINMNKVAEYKYDAITRKIFVFRQGTSYIESSWAARNNVATVYQIQKNSLYFEYLILAVSLSYERMLPIGNRAGIALSVGLMQVVVFIDELYFTGKAALLIGGTRHFFETGIEALTQADTGPFILAGYRYKASKGFLIRIGYGINLKGSNDFKLLPGLSIGYSF